MSSPGSHPALKSFILCNSVSSWNSTRLVGHIHGIVTETVVKTLQGSLFSVENWPLCSFFQTDLFQIYSSLLPPVHPSICPVGVNFVNYLGF